MSSEMVSLFFLPHFFLNMFSRVETEVVVYFLCLAFRFITAAAAEIVIRFLFSHIPTLRRSRAGAEGYRMHP